MAFNVNKFITHFDSHAGFSKTSKFDVIVTVPPFLQSYGTAEELSLQCESAELPGYTINTLESKIFGAPTPVAGTPAFGDVTLTFICAGDLWEKRFFDRWLDFIIPKQTYLVNYKQSYVTDIVIRQYSEGTPGSGSDSAPKPSVIYACKLLNAFPATVNALNLNWGTDDIHRLSVAFKFDRWLDVSAPSVPTNEQIRTSSASVDGIASTSAGQFNIRPTNPLTVPKTKPFIGGGGGFAGGGASGGW
jgi:uncharacterized membrane protein YgcG